MIYVFMLFCGCQEQALRWSPNLAGYEWNHACQLDYALNESMLDIEKHVFLSACMSENNVISKSIVRRCVVMKKE